MQFKFNQQWSRLKAYANAKHIQIVGDIPIYVSPDGADVWAHPELFQLDEHNALTAIAGCPPDAFAEDGQAWGNPLYNWNFHRATDFAWWVSRMWYSFKLYDVDVYKRQPPKRRRMTKAPSRRKRSGSWTGRMWRLLPS